MILKRLLVLFVSGCVFTSLGQVAPKREVKTEQISVDSLHLDSIHELHKQLHMELKKAINKPK